MPTVSSSGIQRPVSAAPSRPESIPHTTLRWWQTRQPRTRLALGAGAAVLLLLSILVPAVARARQYQPLFGFLLSDLDQRDILAVLTREGYDFRLEGGKVLVAPEQQRRIVTLLVVQHGLPHRPQAQAPTGASNGMFPPSSAETRRAELEATRAQLADQIRGFSFVKDCQIQIVLAAEDVSLGGQPAPARASVQLEVRPGQDPAAEQVQALVSLVAYSVPTLVPENVSVVTQDGHDLTRKMHHDGHADNAVLDDDRLALKSRYETLFEAKLRESLDRELGPDAYTLVVDCDLSFGHIGRKTTSLGDPRPLEETKKIERYDTGPKAHSGASEVALLTARPKDAVSYLKEEDKHKNGYNESIQTQEIPAGTLNKVTATLAVDRRLSAQQVAEYEKWLKDGLGIDESRGDRVSVRQSTFVHRTPDAPFVPAAAPAAGGSTVATVMVLGLLTSMLMLAAVYQWQQQRSQADLSRPEREVEIPSPLQDIIDPRGTREGVSLDRSRTTRILGRAHLESLARERPEDIADRLQKVWLLKQEA